MTVTEWDDRMICIYFQWKSEIYTTPKHSTEKSRRIKVVLPAQQVFGGRDIISKHIRSPRLGNLNPNPNFLCE